MTTTKQPKPRSRARKYAEVERINVLGAVARIGPVGMWMYADAYASSAKSLPESSAPFEPVRYFLACHSIELSLKAYLSLTGVTMLELSEGSFGHNLQSVLLAAEAAGLGSVVQLSQGQRDEILKANLYYSGKLFEYPAYGEAVRGYPELPQVSVLLESASALATALAQPCRDAP